MTPAPASLAWLGALQQPQRALAWDLAQWQRVLRLSRRLRLLGRLAEQLHAAGLMPQLPAPVAAQLLAEQRYSRWRTQLMRWTVERLSHTLADIGCPLVLLKGSAYIAQGLPIAAGRLPSDLDILVPQAHIAAVQARLLAAGWAEPELDEHDQRYYREWSHEVPPMQHPVMPLELDLHHNILPPVARVSVQAERLFAQLQPTAWQGWQVLHPHDQVLHCAAHLFHDSELRDRLRDLVDLDGLMRHHAACDAQFWPGLLARAQALGLVEPLALACHLTQRWLGLPMPASAAAALRDAGPPAWRRAWLHPLLETALTPTEPDSLPSFTQGLAAQTLLLRHHLGRMPLRLLLPHLWHKARAARASREKAAAALIADTRSDD